MKPRGLRKPTLIPKVSSLFDLKSKATDDPRYAKLAIVAANNLGGDTRTLAGALRWLDLNAMETSEEGVVGEINFVRDLV